jgi:hypothetical protein
VENISWQMSGHHDIFWHEVGTFIFPYYIVIGTISGDGTDCG